MTVMYGNGIAWSTIHTHMLCTIRLWNYDHENHRRSKTFTYQTYGDKLLYLLFDIFCLFGVGVVGGLIW
jgi:hypothetical protein